MEWQKGSQPWWMQLPGNWNVTLAPGFVDHLEEPVRNTLIDAFLLTRK
jgi:hypothetical protein